jgi:hypothetical protein
LFVELFLIDQQSNPTGIRFLSILDGLLQSQTMAVSIFGEKPPTPRFSDVSFVPEHLALSPL